MTLRSLWNYYRGELHYAANESNDAGNYKINTKRQQQVNLLSIRQK